MHTLTFSYMGTEGDHWNTEAKGETAAEAHTALIKAIQTTAGEMPQCALDEITEHVLNALSTPGKKSERRDFSTPEDNFDVLLT